MLADLRLESRHLEASRLSLMLFISVDLLDIAARAVKERVFVFVADDINVRHVLYNCLATVPQIRGNRVEYGPRPLAKRAAGIGDIVDISGSDRRNGRLGAFLKRPGGL